MITVSQQYQKEAHRSLLMDEIRKRGKVSRAELSRITSLKRSTVTNIITELLGAGLIREVESGFSTPAGGRKPVMLELCAGAACIIGINLEPENAEVLLINLAGLVIDTERIPYKPDRSGQFIADIVRKAYSLLGIRHYATIIAAGIGISGTVDSRQSTIIHSRLFDLHDADLRPLFHRLPVPVFLENDANCGAANAIFLAPEGESFRNGLFILPRIMTDSAGRVNSVELGGAVIVNGEIWHGSRYITGEFSINSWFESQVESVPFTREDLLKVTEDDAMLAVFIETTLTRLIPSARMLDPDMIILSGLLSERFSLVEELLGSSLKHSWYDEADHAARVRQDPNHICSIALGAGMSILHQLYAMPHVGDPAADLACSWGEVLKQLSD